MVRFAGNIIGNTGYFEGKADDAFFSNPTGIFYSVMDKGLYISDNTNVVIRFIAIPAGPSPICGTTSLYAGIPKKYGVVNGPSLSSTFRGPCGITQDRLGNLFVVDTDNHMIRKITKNGTVSIFAGSTQGCDDQNAKYAKFNQPTYITIDAEGNLLVSDSGNSAIRMISTEGVVLTVAGSAQLGSLALPKGILFSSYGSPHFYFSDSKNNIVKQISISSSQTTTKNGISTALNSFTSIITAGSETLLPSLKTKFGTLASTETLLPAVATLACPKSSVASINGKNVTLTCENGQLICPVNFKVSLQINGTNYPCMNAAFKPSLYGGLLFFLGLIFVL